VLTLHLAMLGLGLLLCRAARVDRADAIAVGFASSQKTLAVGLQLAAEYHASLLPMITYHAGQLILDTLIADRMRANATEERTP
jgi:sodium/bile acid cotransporter 7